MIPNWFLYLQGFAMVLMGVALLLLKPRQRGDSFYKRYINAATLWALVCCAAGVALLSMALGYWNILRPPADPSPVRAHRRVR